MDSELDAGAHASTHPLWSDLTDRRDAERARIGHAFSVVSGDELAYELTPIGFIKWYLHPALEGPVLRSMLFYEQMIPPGSRGGTLKHPGGAAHMVVEGHGKFVIDGLDHEFWAADVVLLPVTGVGITYCIENLSADEPVRIIGAMPNLIEPLGIDMGAGLDVVEPAPEYSAQTVS